MLISVSFHMRELCNSVEALFGILAVYWLHIGRDAVISDWRRLCCRAVSNHAISPLGAFYGFAFEYLTLALIATPPNCDTPQKSSPEPQDYLLEIECLCVLDDVHYKYHVSQLTCKHAPVPPSGYNRAHCINMRPPPPTPI